MKRRTVSVIGTLAGVVVAIALAGCATPAGGGATTGPRNDPTPTAAPTPSADATSSADIRAAWLDGGRVIGLVTTGSSTCIPTAPDPTLEGGVLSVTLEDLDKACTRDFVPRVTLVQVPEGLDPAQDLEIAVSGSVDGQTALAAAAGLAGGTVTEYLPSAGWTGAEGQLVVLTWGSSTCPPMVADAAATGPSEVTVTFADPPADQVCTMDMGPRGTLVEVAGLSASAGAELVLMGDAFDGVRLPIVG